MRAPSDVDPGKQLLSHTRSTIESRPSPSMSKISNPSLFKASVCRLAASYSALAAVDGSVPLYLLGLAFFGQKTLNFCKNFRKLTLALFKSSYGYVTSGPCSPTSLADLFLASKVFLGGERISDR